MNKFTCIALLATLAVAAAAVEKENKFFFRPRPWTPIGPVNPAPANPAPANPAPANPAPANPATCPSPQNGCTECAPAPEATRCPGGDAGGTRALCFDRFAPCPAPCKCEPLCENNCRV